MSNDPKIIYSKLLSNVCSGRFEEVEETLKHYSLSYSKDWEEGYTLLKYSTIYKHKNISKLLLDYGARVNINGDYSLNTPLHYAVSNCCIETVKILLLKGANFNATNNYEISPFYLAVEKKSLMTAKLLLKFGASVNSCVTYSPRLGYTPLHVAVESRNEDMTKLILGNNALIDAKTVKYGFTALHIAAYNGLDNIVRLLLKHNANIESRDKDDKTPLRLAIKNTFAVVARLLLERGADVNAKDMYGFTALTDAICDLNVNSALDNESYVKLLLDHKADPNSRSCVGGTPLHFAIHFERKQDVRYLLEFGADINLTNDYQKVPLEYALNLIKYDTNCDLVETIKDHILKMKVSNFYISNTNLQLLDNSFDSMNTKYENELKAMKAKLINNTNVSFYDILIKNKHKLAILFNNKNVLKVLESEEYKSEFPSYSSMIQRQFKRGTERKALVEKATELLNSFPSNFNKFLPDCMNELFCYFKDEDLRCFVDSIKTVA